MAEILETVGLRCSVVKQSCLVHPTNCNDPHASPVDPIALLPELASFLLLSKMVNLLTVPPFFHRTRACGACLGDWDEGVGCRIS